MNIWNLIYDSWITNGVFWTAIGSVATTASLVFIYLTNNKQISSIKQQAKDEVRPIFDCRIAKFSIEKYLTKDKPDSIMCSYPFSSNAHDVNSGLIQEYKDFFEGNNEFFFLRLLSEKRIMRVAIKLSVVSSLHETNGKYQIYKILPYLDSDESIYFHIPSLFSQILQADNVDLRCSLQIKGITSLNENFCYTFQGKKDKTRLVDNLVFSILKKDYHDQTQDVLPDIKIESKSLSMDFKDPKLFYRTIDWYFSSLNGLLKFGIRSSGKSEKDQILEEFEKNHWNTVKKYIEIDLGSGDSFSIFKRTFFDHGEDSDARDFNQAISQIDSFKKKISTTETEDYKELLVLYKDLFAQVNFVRKYIKETISGIYN